VVPPSVAAAVLGDVRIERAGNQRWLVVKRTPDQLWPGVREFWRRQRLRTDLEQSDIGIMETDWAENRAKIPQDFLRATLGKVLDNLYSTAERDKFRTRLEANAGGANRDLHQPPRRRLKWMPRTGRVPCGAPRASDPELEAEFVRRMMVRLGAPRRASPVASGGRHRKAQVPSGGGCRRNRSCRFPKGSTRRGARVGLTLDRTGFTVEDRDRKQGIYFVRYVANSAPMKNRASWSLVQQQAQAAGSRQVPDQCAQPGDTSTLAVLDAAGAPVKSDSAQKIVELIAQDLR